MNERALKGVVVDAGHGGSDRELLVEMCMRKILH